jgi:metal-sulfur cluster biosynthetic enzyme
MNNPETLKENILTALQEVIDPETGVDVIRMRLVENLAVDKEGVVRYTFRPSSPVCPIAVTLAMNIKYAVGEVEGVESQEITIEDYVNAKELSEYLSMMP